MDQNGAATCIRWKHLEAGFASGSRVSPEIQAIFEAPLPRLNWHNRCTFAELARFKEFGARIGEVAKDLCELTGTDMDHVATHITRESLQLHMLLRDAAIAGVVLSFNPQDSEMRDLAEKSWDGIRSLLSHHLLGEEEPVLQWAAKRAAFSDTMTGRLKKRHAGLRTLVRRIDAVSFEYGRGDEVACAAKALCDLAVKLDDLVEGEEHRLLPILRRYVFALQNGDSAADKAVSC